MFPSPFAVHWVRIVEDVSALLLGLNQFPLYLEIVEFLGFPLNAKVSTFSPFSLL
jgi:hypothetical protein